MNIKRLLLFVILFFAASCASYGKDVSVKGYFRKDGTYVAPHMRSAPNNTAADNWSAKGNVNPYTGKPGTKNVPEDAFSGSNSVAASTAAPSATYNGAIGSVRSPAPVGETDDEFLKTKFPKIAPKLIPLVAGFRESNTNEPYSSWTTQQVLVWTFSYVVSKDAAEQFPELAIAVATTLIQDSSVAQLPTTKATNASNEPAKADAAKGAPSLAQWRKMKANISMDSVEQILGIPKSIRNSGTGEYWQYEGGGWVDFFPSGSVSTFGGYASGN